MANKVRFLGHAAFEIITCGEKRILIDPWITGNPLCPVKREELKDPDLILITHDHADHIGEDVPFLVGGSESVVVTQPELLGKLKEAGVAERNFVFGTGMNIGGTVRLRESRSPWFRPFTLQRWVLPAASLLQQRMARGSTTQEIRGFSQT